MCTSERSFLRRIGRVLFLTMLSGASLAPSFSQTSTSASNTKTWILASADEIQVPAPPAAAQTQQELAQLKKQTASQNNNNLHQIQYWNAGAPAYRWNQLATRIIEFQDFNTFLRTPSAWMNLAIYDATIVALKAKQKYQRKRPTEVDHGLKPLIQAPATASYPCEHSVTAAAAATVLAYFYPKKADSIMQLAKQAAQSRVDAGVQFPSDMEAGWKVGEAVAQRIIEAAKKDNSDKQWSGSMKNDPKLWHGPYPVGLTAGSFRPLVLKSGDQLRPPPPPDFAADMQLLKDFKQNPHSVYLAHYWASLNGFDIWTDLANEKIFELRMQDNTLACQRIYTVLHVAMHDAAIVIMDAKYAYWGIRPYQYDTTFKPLIGMPPFPGYPSGHATASSTAATVLSHFFPADASRFRQLAEDCANSRFYAGIHFKTDNVEGLALGKKLGDYVYEKTMKSEVGSQK
jgi:membrane-associated phospholipid phosphatase